MSSTRGLSSRSLPGQERQVFRWIMGAIRPIRLTRVVDARDVAV